MSEFGKPQTRNSAVTIVDNPRPEFSIAEAKELLQAHFGIEGGLTSLPSERDQNFRVRTPDGQGLTFKIMNAAEPLSAIEFQTALLRHLESSDPGLPSRASCPR